MRDRTFDSRFRPTHSFGTWDYRELQQMEPGRIKGNLMRPFTVLIVAVCGLVTGCATEGPQPTEQLTKARVVIEQAEKAQAQRYAAPDLQRARDELSAAETANNKGSYDTARRYAESAAVDADLASARATAGEALRAAQEATKGNSALQHESERAAEGSAPASVPVPPRSNLEAYPPASPATPAPPPDAVPRERPPNPQ
jgi:hypothetical protein